MQIYHGPSSSGTYSIFADLMTCGDNLVSHRTIPYFFSSSGALLGSAVTDDLFAAAFCASLSSLNAASFFFPVSLSLAEPIDMPLPEEPGRESAREGPLLEFGRESVGTRETDRRGDTDRRGEDELRRRV